MNDKNIQRKQRLQESKKLYCRRAKLAKQIQRERRPPLPWKEMLLIALLTTKPRNKRGIF